MSFESFWSDVSATVLGGVILTAFFFFAKEKLFPLPHVDGRWYLEQITKVTEYAPYNGMLLRYIVVLWRSGNRIEGTAEKVFERSLEGDRSYIGDNRTRAIVTGHIEKRYLGKDKIFLHVIEDGHGRESTNAYELIVASEDILEGAFSSMVANQSGSVKCQRTPFQ